jgi:hypothetical protein
VNTGAILVFKRNPAEDLTGCKFVNDRLLQGILLQLGGFE